MYSIPRGREVSRRDRRGVLNREWPGSYRLRERPSNRSNGSRSRRRPIRRCRPSPRPARCRPTRPGHSLWRSPADGTGPVRYPPWKVSWPETPARRVRRLLLVDRDRPAVREQTFDFFRRHLHKHLIKLVTVVRCRGSMMERVVRPDASAAGSTPGRRCMCQPRGSFSLRSRQSQE